MVYAKVSAIDLPPIFNSVALPDKADMKTSVKLSLAAQSTDGAALGKVLVLWGDGKFSVQNVPEWLIAFDLEQTYSNCFHTNCTSISVTIHGRSISLNGMELKCSVF